MESVLAAGLPYYRAILAVDIERSTSRPNPIKGELRNKIYELFEAALRMTGISTSHRDQFIDRGDGILALIHPVDQAPKALLLNRAVPVLSRLLADYNASLPRFSHLNGNCGSASSCTPARSTTTPTDASVRRWMSPSACSMPSGSSGSCGRRPDPLILVISGDIYNSVVRHGYDGIDQQTFHPLVRVHVAGKRFPGWIHLPEQVTEDNVTRMAAYRRPA